MSKPQSRRNSGDIESIDLIDQPRKKKVIKKIVRKKKKADDDGTVIPDIAPQPPVVDLPEVKPPQIQKSS